MLSQTNPVTFAPSVSETINLPQPTTGLSFTAPLPAVDPSNTALTLTNNAPQAVFFQFGNPAVIPSGPNVVGPSVGVIQSGQTILIQSAAGAATNIGLSSSMGGSIVATRGTASTAQVFS